MSTNGDIRLFCVTHKDVPGLPHNGMVTPILVGEAPSAIALKVRDYYPELSRMNKTWNEMEAVYYIWKQVHSPIKGQFQYGKHLGGLYGWTIRRWLRRKPVIASIEPLFEDRHRTRPISLRDQYAVCHYLGDLDLCREIVLEQYPQWAGLWDRVMSGSRILHGGSFVARSEDYDAYCAFVFPVLQEFLARRGFTDMKTIEAFYEAHPTDNQGNSYQTRVVGFLAERLLTFWVCARWGSLDTAVKNRPLIRTRLRKKQNFVTV